MNKNRKKKVETESAEEVKLKGFLDMIAPSVIQFYTDHYICGNTFRSVWALREYPTATDEQAILRHLGEKDGVTLRIYTRQVTPTEEKKIISNAANKNRMKQGNTENLQESSNEKYTFRTWLLRLGMIGDEFKTARKFLLENLEDSIAWKDPTQAERQKERLRAKKEKEESLEAAKQAEVVQETEEALETEQEMSMSM